MLERRLMRDGRRRRRHLEPDDLPEGARRGRRVRRAAAASSRSGRDRREGDLPPARGEGHPGRAATCCGRSGTSASGKDGYVSLEVDPTLAYEREDDVRADDPPARAGSTAPNLLVKIPATRPGLAAIEDCDRAGQVDQRHADLLAPALPRGRRGVPPRARAARRGRRRPVDGRVGRELLRLARRHRGRQAAGGDRHARGARAARQARDREREARVRALAARRSRASAGSPSPARARRTSAASGRRPRRRTPSTAT